ncbi:MAG: hypothetical protein EAY70_09345 [Sphingomonadales bacterium]|nr:MAG: hypothetical protein EAY70_09345 [Sphingomonadales bacterium]
MQRAQVAELLLLFAKGKRPDRHAIRVLAGRLPTLIVSHDPLADDAPHAEALWPGQLHWLELLRDGLTFDLSGLEPGPAGDFPQLVHRFDLPTMPADSEFEPMSLRLGPHLEAGGNSMSLMRGLMAVACDMVRQFEDLAAVVWGPAQTAIGRRFFESTTSAWLDGGPFPSLGLTAFVETPDGALESVGLGFWIGQELRIEPPLSSDRVAATRLGIRLVNHLVMAGEITEDHRIIAADGTRLVLKPSCGSTIISVLRE